MSKTKKPAQVKALPPKKNAGAVKGGRKTGDDRIAFNDNRTLVGV